MSQPIVEANANASCPRCGANVPGHLTRCGICGCPLEEAIPVADVAPTKQSSGLAGLAENPYLVLVTIFFVTAAFGIPLIWMCRAWSDMTKAILTIVTIVYTIVILWLFYLVMAWCWSRISGSF